MSDKAAMDRQLAEKKQKLEELRRAKAARQQQMQQSIDDTSSGKLTAAAINLAPQQSTSGAVVAPAPKQSAEDILNSVSSLISLPASTGPAPAGTAPANAAAAGTPTNAHRPLALGKSHAMHTDILPGDAKILYEQATQTEKSKREAAAAEAAAAAANGDAVDAKSASAGTNTTLSVWDRIAEDERDEIIHERDDLRIREVELLGRIKELTAAASERAAAAEAAQEAKQRDLTRAEAEAIEKSEEFGSFLERSSKIMERLLGYESSTRGVNGTGATGMLGALSSRFDYMEDYSAADENESTAMGAGGQGKLTPSVVFSVEGGASATTNRPITSIAWSSKYPELLSASYATSHGTADDSNTDAAWHDQDGQVLVWNLHMARRPEYTFTCQSAIHTQMFHPAHPKLLVGGCENGQLLIWDMRTNKQTPVNRSSLSHGHTHPVFSLAIQSLNSGLYQIVSCSSDGQVCIWTENNLHRPLHDIQLVNMRPSSLAGVTGGDAASAGGALLGSREDITTTMFDLSGRDTNSLILGSDEGRIYKARLHEAKESERIYETIHAHEAPMTAIEFHPASRHQATGTGTASSDLFLTASYDWTVKLWSHKLSRPLYTFESARDYVYSAAWCPSNPYVFAQGDGTGKLDVWSLASPSEEAEVPALSVQVGAEHTQPAQQGATSPSNAGASGDAVDGTSALPTLRQSHAISKLKWNDSGSMIACGTSSGSLHLYDVSPDLYTPTREATDTFYAKISNRITQPH